MFVKSLTVTDFRNLHALELQFGSSVNVFFGRNGSGKTNLLEAIFTLCLGRSQRGAPDGVLINIDAEYYRLKGVLGSNGDEIELAVAYQKGGRKKISLNSVPIRAAELYEQMSLVAAGPEDSEILSGPPSARRLFLDLYLSQLSQTYLADLSDYQKALTQKNAALRREMDPTPFNPLLVSIGSKIMTERASFLERLANEATRFYGEVSDGETLRVQYLPRVPVEAGESDVGAVAEAFANALERIAPREEAAQTSLVGPHRDEVQFDIGGLPARTHGSQGQWRSAAISLKLAVYELLKEKRKVAPIMLLDEIFAELDNERAGRLVERFFEADQLFLTTAVTPPESLLGNARRFRIDRGEVVEAV